ncbi:MAG: hypothetical protein L6R41_008512, partial [Letrouitia leprolyta]
KPAEAEASSNSSGQQQQPSTSTSATNPSISTPTRPSNTDPSTNSQRVNEYIGPVQFNMGGIQVDADEMVKRLKQKGGEGKKQDFGQSTPDAQKKQNEDLAQFFQGLLEKGRKVGGSPRVAGRDGSVGTPVRGAGKGGEGGGGGGGN